MSVWTNGIAYDDNDGAIHVAIDGVITHYNSGLPLADNGSLVASFGETPVLWVAGIPIDANGRVCMAAPIPPTTVTGFDTGFDNGFGAF